MAKDHLEDQCLSRTGSKFGLDEEYKKPYFYRSNIWLLTNGIGVKEEAGAPDDGGEHFVVNVFGCSDHDMEDVQRAEDAHEEAGEGDGCKDSKVAPHWKPRKFGFCDVGVMHCEILSHHQHNFRMLCPELIKKVASGITMLV
jgi:hypothetical protein